jgi:glucosamine--fructose-6-phosphate aminotransferase (isomerizing)
MCGIVGYVGNRPVQELLLQGLQRLEYRGYDSAGVSVLGDDGEIDTIRAVGNLANLYAAVAQRAEDGDGALATATGTAPGTTGIGHTRWATHGRVTEANAHPHTDNADDVHVVVNGIVENFLPLKQRLRDTGAVFTSETDAEVIAHLISLHMATGDLVEAVRRTYNELEGHFSFVAMHRSDAETLVGARRECPLVIGVGEGENFLASDVSAFLSETRRVQWIENGELVVIRRDETVIMTPDGEIVDREISVLDWDQETAEKEGYETFMLKEIHDQGESVAETIGDRTLSGTGVDFSLEFDEDILRGAKRIVILACGTSYHAGLIGRYAMTEWARIPVAVDIASEYRYANPVVGEGDLVIGISQSGETADTLAAMRLAQERGATVLAVTNVMGSQATRDSDAVAYTRAGQEIGVAATKTFVCQVAVMYLLAIRLAELRGTLAPERVTELVGHIKRLPKQIDDLVESLDGSGQIRDIAERHGQCPFFLYLGRHAGLPVALEGALKLKEISYIPTDAYAAGEMKHGPIALLDESTPVIVAATDSHLLDKVVSNMQEVRARGAHVIAVATEGNVDIGEHAEEVIRVPSSDWLIQPLLAIIPLQLMAYAIARSRGLNVDQPRNLAKTVTVE